MSAKKAPDCYQCRHRRNLPGNCHISCANLRAEVTGSREAIRRGWFYWPLSFDPVWLKSCDGFQPKEQG